MRELPSPVKGAGLKIRYRRISWVRIPPLAPNFRVIGNSKKCNASVKIIHKRLFSKLALAKKIILVFFYVFDLII